MIALYGRGSFILRMILMYMEFANVDEILENIEVNISVTREHVRNLEIMIMNVNEHGRGIANELKY